MSALSAISGGGYTGRVDPWKSQQGWAKDYRANQTNAALTSIARTSSNEEEKYRRMSDWARSMGNTDLGIGVSGSGGAWVFGDMYGQLKQRRLEEEALGNARADRAFELEKRNWQRDSWKRSKDMMDKMSSGGGLSAGGNFRVSGV